MLTFLPGPIRGAVSVLIFFVNTIVWTIPLILLHFVKLALPARGWRAFWSRVQSGLGSAWVTVNNWNLGLTNPVRWDIRGTEGLVPNHWYLVVANHQSTVDILVLQRALNGKVPFLKFFLKKELFRVPLLGLAWWALDYPFLERSATATKDLESIRRAAGKFKIIPVAVMNFVEGTRFTPEKHEKQRSPYAHLLKPKAGGLTFILSDMGRDFRCILDVTIAYPQGIPGLWEFLRGGAGEIKVWVNSIPIGEELLGDFAQDKAFRRQFTGWVKELWEAKDEQMKEMLGEGVGPEA